MCGIFAAIGAAAADVDGAARALTLLAERGPHGSARLVEDGLVLGLARLAIVAPDAPPRVHETGGCAGVMNGELYEHGALRGELGIDDTSSDQAVAVALFARVRGGDAFTSARGPVTGAFFDRGQKTLTLVRDRFGKRPLFIDVVEGGVRAASEMKALLVARKGPLRFSRVAIGRFLARGILEDALPLVAGIESVPPGAIWRVDARGQVDRVGAARAAPTSTSTDLPDLGGLLRAACARRTGHLEVDAAVLLSGGLDSSVVAALCRGRGMPAYTMRIGESGRDETDKARAAAAALGLEHVVVDVVAPTFADLAACAWRLESPDAFTGFGLAHAYRTLAQRLRADGVRVVLTGEGADEVFMGYPWQRAQAAAQNGWPFPDVGVDELGWATASLALPRSSRALEVFLRASFGAPLGARDATLLCRPEALADGEHEGAEQGVFAGARGAERRRRESLHVDLPMWPLRIADRMLMGHGVEPRAPFLDEDVVDAALQRPADLFESAHQDKPVLRALAAELLPFVPAAKQGFGAWSWPGAATTCTWARALLREGTLLVREAAVDQLAASASSSAPGEEGAALLLWRLVVLEVTARQLDAARSGAPWQP